ncbi:G-protein coupled receptor family C group 5 member B [Bagarius yarrelli]|uniref:G-protein coupled receptor family C group 5 member B n=1 Tax=Bagarius yarrelli TaxID=175774 RepID=A0A556TL52_BAGYA|nr:G-protein coupled receptor family C group 5 member B [Bagarius yarrelli]
MKITPILTLLICLLLCSAGASSVESPPPPKGCGTSLHPSYRLLCDLESVWGVVLEAVACGGTISALVLFTVLLLKLKMVSEPERRSGVGPLLLLLLSTVGLFSLSLAFMVGHGETVCVLRRGLWSSLFALCFSCLLVQGVRLRKLATGKRSPSGGSLSALAFGMALVQGILSGEWLLLTVVREGRSACDYPPLDFALVCGYALGLLLTSTTVSLGVLLCGSRHLDDAARKKRRQWSCNGVWLFLSCLVSLLVWAAWLGFYLYGNSAGKSTMTSETDGEEPALAIALVMEGWALLLFHAIPEAHLCLRTTSQRAEEGGQDYYDARQPQSLHGYRDDDELPANHRAAYTDRQTFSIEEHSTGMQPGGYHATVIRPTPQFRSHVYQPTEMALLMNGGTCNSCTLWCKDSSWILDVIYPSTGGSWEHRHPHLFFFIFLLHLKDFPSLAFLCGTDLGNPFGLWAVPFYVTAGMEDAVNF